MSDKHPSSDLTADQVRTQCDRILASEGFARSQRQSAFLKYIVNSTLEGEANSLKEFTLGIEVFDKDESFDPGVDSIVRVEASRLRSKLSEYYAGEGHGDSVRIDIPKGHYVPAFSFVEAPQVIQGATTSWKLWGGFFAAVLAIIIVYGIFWVPGNESTSGANIPSPSSPNSIAVVPLRDWSRVPEEYYSDAMTDALITALAETQTLRVTSLTSVMRYKNTEVPVPEIGQALGVAYILEGSVSRDTDRALITAQLIETATDKHVWAKTFDRPVSDLLAVQSEVAAAVATHISNKLVSPSNLHATNIDPIAYEAFLKGRYFYNQFSTDGFQRGIEYFQTAIDIEPNYAEAYAGLASCHCLLAGHGLEVVAPVDSIPVASTMATRALSLNQDLAEPYAFLGIINFKYEWNLKDAEVNLNRALEINPSLFRAHIWLSQILEAMNRNDDALDFARMAKKLNPLSLEASLNLGWQLYQAENIIEANAEIDKLIEFNPKFWGGHWAKGHIYNQNQSHLKAIEKFSLAVELKGGHSLPLAALGYSYAIAGMPEKAQQIISRLETLSKETYVSPFHIATIYAGLNQPDLMFDQLERAYQVRARSLAWMQVKKELKPFHDDSRFQKLLDRIGIYPGQ